VTPQEEALIDFSNDWALSMTALTQAFDSLSRASVSAQSAFEAIERVLDLHERVPHADYVEGLCRECRRIEEADLRWVETEKYGYRTSRWPCPTRMACGAGSPQ
jgi:hypothetical protein